MEMEMEMERDKSEMKRGRSQMETGEAAGRKKVAGQTKTDPKPPPTSLFASSMKRLEEVRLKRVVVRLNAENPGAPPIVLEALTEEQRALLLQQEKKRREEGRAQRLAELEQAHEAEMARQPPPPPEDPNQDVDERNYSWYRQEWQRKRATRYGSFDQTTDIPAMCFTDNPMPGHIYRRTTMHIFAVKVAEINGDLKWPLDVFGTVAVRDRLDYRRNIIFDRTRDNCQTLKEQDPYLVLTGPTRAVVHDEYVWFDAALKVKGATESEDIDLSLVFTRYACCERINLCVSEGEGIGKSCVSTRRYTSKLSTLEFTCGLVVSSVEATITVRVVKGSWPDGCRGRFTAFIPSVDHMKVLLLDSGEKTAPTVADDNGTVQLSRRVVSAESFGQLIVCASMVVSRDGSNQVAESKVSFAPSDACRSQGMLDLGGCKMEVTVAWSLLLIYYPSDAFPPSKGSAGEAAAATSS